MEKIMMKKINFLALTLLTVARTTQGSSTVQRSANQTNTTSENSSSGFATTIADAMKAPKPQPVTIPSDVVGKLQRLTAIQMEKAKGKSIVLAFDELEGGGSNFRNLTTVMASNGDFMNKLNTYKNYSSL
jgi:hypothetical protein